MPIEGNPIFVGKDTKYSTKLAIYSMGTTLGFSMPYRIFVVDTDYFVKHPENSKHYVCLKGGRYYVTCFAKGDYTSASRSSNIITIVPTVTVTVYRTESSTTEVIRNVENVTSDGYVDGGVSFHLSAGDEIFLDVTNAISGSSSSGTHCAEGGCIIYTYNSRMTV